MLITPHTLLYCRCTACGMCLPTAKCHMITVTMANHWSTLNQCSSPHAFRVTCHIPTDHRPQLPAYSVCLTRQCVARVTPLR